MLSWVRYFWWFWKTRFNFFCIYQPIWTKLGLLFWKFYSPYFVFETQNAIYSGSGSNSPISGIFENAKNSWFSLISYSVPKLGNLAQVKWDELLVPVSAPKQQIKYVENMLASLIRVTSMGNMLPWVRYFWWFWKTRFKLFFLVFINRFWRGWAHYFGNFIPLI